MEKNCMAYIITLAALFVGCLPVWTQVAHRPSRAAMDSILNPALYSGAEKILLFDKSKEDIGTIYEHDSARSVKFVFRNVSDSPVKITRVTTHCGCTAASSSPDIVAPGSEGEVCVTYNPKGRSGTIDADAFVYADFSGNSPVARLTVLGNVVDDNEWGHLPYIMGTLRLKRKQVVFGNGRTVCRIACANVGTKPLTLFSPLLPDFVSFSTEPQTLKPDEEGDIVITIDADNIHGNKRFSVVVGGVEGKISSRTIDAIIE